MAVEYLRKDGGWQPLGGVDDTNYLTADDLPFINVKDFGAIGDGVTDDTAAFQAMLADMTPGSAADLGDGTNTYILNQTLVPAVDNITIRASGAKLKAGASLSGDMLTYGWHIKLEGRTNVVIEGIRIADPGAVLSAEAEASAIRMNNSVRCKVRRCHLERADRSGQIMNAGASSVGCEITDNYLYGQGISAHYAGASKSLCARNVIDTPVGNGISGTGNNGVANNTDNVIEDNLILNAGRMGIEDGNFGGVTLRTVIRRNRVLTTGVVAGADGFGISAVGNMTCVDDNTIVNPRTYGIELAGNGNRARGNHVTYSANHSIGLVAQGVSADGVAIVGNLIENSGGSIGAAGGIVASGALAGPMLIANNTIVDPRADGIAINPSSAAVNNVTVEGNLVVCAVALAVVTERALFTANGTPSGIRVIGNTFRYASGASGAGYLARLTGNDLHFEGNVFDDASGGTYSVITFGATPARTMFLGNVWLGTAACDITGATRVAFIANRFVSAPTGDGTTNAGTTFYANHTGSTFTDEPLRTEAFFELVEHADPAAPAANRARLYSRDNGSGKTQLVVRFPTGAVQVLATEP